MKYLLTLSLIFAATAHAQHPPHQANGIKIGAVTHTSAKIWTRLTATPDWKQAPDETVEAWRVPGTAGAVRLTWWKNDEIANKQSTDWASPTAENDYIHEFDLTDLEARTAYALLSEGRDAKGEVHSMVVGKFRTPADKTVSQKVRFCVVTGQGYHRRDTPQGHQIYPQMQKLDLDFFAHTGDIVYYDKPDPEAKTLDLARLHWQRMYALPYQRDFHANVASLFIKDDHDTLKNDSWPGQVYGEFTWEQGLALFDEVLPTFDPPYQTLRYGKDLQIWIVEGRNFRSANSDPDGPEKTIWGEQQLAWFKKTVKASEATFRILISPTPIVGPDRGGKNDNHANKGFTHEGDIVRKFIGKQKNMYVICGDRHWQYVSEDPETGVREYSCGPTSDKHAGGWSNKKRTERHKYLNVKGGFLSVEIDGTSATFRHHGVDGSLYNEEVRNASGVQ